MTINSSKLNQQRLRFWRSILDRFGWEAVPIGTRADLVESVVADAVRIDTRLNPIVDPNRYQGPGDWFSTLRSQGFSVPPQAPHLIGQVMKKQNLTFQEAFSVLTEAESLIISGRTIIVDLSALDQ